MKRTTTLLCLLASLALSQDASVKPGINSKFLDPKLNVEEWTKKFETESREIFLQREKIVAAAGLKLGMAMADIGAGTGLFTLHFAKAVGADGKVFAVEIAKNLLEHLTLHVTGTPVGFADREEIEAILGACGANGFRVKDLIHALVQSRIFLGSILQP